MHWWLPLKGSTFAGEVDGLFLAITIITGIAFVLVEVGLIWFVVKYRQRPGQKAFYTHGNTRAEVIWTTIPAVTMVALGLISNHYWVKIKGRHSVPANAYPIAIHAKQFEWQVTYPGADGQLGRLRNDDRCRDGAHSTRASRRPELHPEVHLLDRSQDHRDPVPVRQPVLPAGGRAPGDADALAARLSRAADAGRRDPPREHGAGRGHSAGVLHPTGHHARHVHGVLRYHAAARGCVRELPDPAQDRDARHGIPAHQHVVVLVVLRGRARDAVEPVRAGRRGPRRVDDVRAAVGAARLLGRIDRAGALVGLDHSGRIVVHPGLLELHHDDHQQPRPGDDVVPSAALGVVPILNNKPGTPGPAGAVGRGEHAAVRPDAANALLRPSS